MLDEPRGQLRLTTAPHPFRVAHEVVELPEGSTLAELLDQAQPDPILRRHAVIFIAGHVIERRYWHTIRPKAGVHVEIRVLPATGGNTLRLVLTIAVVALAFAAPYLAPAGSFFAAGSLGGSLLTAAISTVGMLAINALVPVRPPKQRGLGAPESVFGISGTRNRARPFEPVPAVLGRHRVTPDYGAQPYTEVVGDDQYLRLIFLWGIGPLSIDTSTLKIGETPLTDFDGVETEHREGYDSDQPLTLYPGTVTEDSFSIKLLEVDSWQVRTSAADADELSVDIALPSGLFDLNLKSGGTSSLTLDLEIAYRKVGDAMWLAPTYTATTVPASWIAGTAVTLNHDKRSTIRHGFRWSVAERAQYEVRLRRVTLDDRAGFDEGEATDDLFWTALRAFTDEDPIQSRVPVAKTALRIKATEQLNGVVDEFNGVVTAKGDDWNGSTWDADQEITNPASLYRLILQGNANAAPLADSRLDLTGLQDWHDFCVTKGYTANQPRASDGSVWDALADIAAAGRAVPIQVDGKWSVAIEETKATPVSHITPRNSYDFRSEKAFIDLPHAFRIPFPNEDEGWRTDERRVYRTGFDASTATRFEELNLPGVTDPDQVWRLGRYRMAQGIHHPERWTWRQDMEFLTYGKGDRVALTHDVLLVGLHSGRVKSVTIDGSNNVTALELDEQVTMEAGKSYGIAIRTVANANVTEQVVTNAGDQTSVTLSTPIAPVGGSPAITAGDLFGFGLLGSETDDATVIAIKPETEFQAQIVAVPYREAIFDDDATTIPPFQTNLTPVATLPVPMITDVISDESVLVFAPGEGLQTRIAISWTPISGSDQWRNLRVEVQGRPSATGEPFASMEVDEREGHRIIISGVQDGKTFDLRLRFTADDRLPGAWAYVYNHTVVGKSTPPAGLSGLTISAFSGQAYLRWDRPDEIDVRLGGEVQFRHSADMSGATWATSTSIGEAARARDLIATLPLKPGTYLARVFDVSGNPSDVIASVTTKQASVLAFASAATLDEDPGFSGTHSNTAVDSGTLFLAGEGLLDDVADFDAVADLDLLGGIAASGTYDFASGFDLGSVKRVRLTTRIDAVSVNTNDLIDNRTDPIDAWEDFDGDTQGAGDVTVQVRHTDDDPAGTPTWSAWEQLDSAEFEARGFDFRAMLSTSDPAFNVNVTDLGVDAEEVV